MRVHVTDAETQATVGRLSVTVAIWELLRDWITAAKDLGENIGADIEIREREHQADLGKRPQTMRGRLLEAVDEASKQAREGIRDGAQAGQDATSENGQGKGATDTRDARGGTKAGRIGPLWRGIQARKGRPK